MNKRKPLVISLKFISIFLLSILFVVSTAGVTYAMYTIAIEIEGWSAKVEVEGDVAGVGKVELKEHEPILNNGIYSLSDKEINYGYSDYYVFPGLDIPKDPFVRVSGKFGVACELYLKVIKENFPKQSYYDYYTGKGQVVDEESITFDIDVGDTTWGFYKAIDDNTSIYKYNGQIETGKEISFDVNVLKEKKLVVSSHYEWQRNQNFSLIFEAYVDQK